MQVNRRATVPSYRQEGAGERMVLVPLAAAVARPRPVAVEFTYVADAPSEWQSEFQAYGGPRFDLPLQNISWTLYLPKGYEYDEFEGTLTPVEETVKRHLYQDYDLAAYEADVVRGNVRDREKAVELQSEANSLVERGRQYAARQALESAWLYSLSDQALNEDTRVQLHRLNREQAIVGLVGRRSALKQQGASGQASAQAGPGGPDLGDQFNTADAERLQNSLSKADSENLEMITERLIEMQEAAAGSRVQLMINMPLRGRRIELTRPLQVQPGAAMEVQFECAPVAHEELRARTPWTVALFLAFLVCFSVRLPRPVTGGGETETAAAPEPAAVPPPTPDQA